LTKSYHLPALHQLTNDSFSDEENMKVFGPCSRLHGHDYVIEITVSGTVDEYSGVLFARDELDRIVDDKILGPFKGKNLSHYFTHTTGEALAVEFHRILEPQFTSPTYLSRLTVNETAKNSFQIR
jgi:6-pyruvoyltetrahydropterin/6-carboxytetrahydropterin synthase